MTSRTSFRNRSALILRCGGVGLVVAALLSGVCLSAAEIVYRYSNPEKISGAIQEISPKGILLKPPKGDPLRISPDDIKQIQWEGEPIILRTARGADLAERSATALEGYRTALKELTEEQKKFREEAEFGIARCLSRQAATEPAVIPEATTALNDFLKAYPDSLHYFDAVLFAADLADQADQAEAAAEKYRILRDSNTGTYPLLGDLGVAESLLAKKDYAGARDSLQRVVDSSLKGPLVPRRQQQARMGMAEILAAEGKSEDAVKVLAEVIQRTPPDETKTLARAYLSRGNCFLKLGNRKRALMDYLHVDLLFSQESAAHAEALYHLVSLWPALQHADRGADARDRLLSLYPDSDWAKQPPQ